MEKLQYPDTKKVDQIDDYHGTIVLDPYRWLEDSNSEQTKEWIKGYPSEKQNKAAIERTLGFPPRLCASKSERNVFSAQKHRIAESKCSLRDEFSGRRKNRFTRSQSAFR